MTEADAPHGARLHCAGLTNDCLVASSHDLAVRYNDRSVLENHHCSTFSRCAPSLASLTTSPAAVAAAKLETPTQYMLSFRLCVHFKKFIRGQCMTEDSVHECAVPLYMHCKY